MKAKVVVPNSQMYPYAAIVKGLKASGYEIARIMDKDNDLVVSWSPWRNTPRETECRNHPLFVVMENGWFSPIAGKKYYQVALWGFNGQGVFVDDNRNRLNTFGLKPMNDFCKPNGPWLIAAQRGGKGDFRYMPPEWPEQMAKKLVNAKIHYKDSGEDPLDLLERIKPRAVVTWGSNFASWALWCGIPVFYCGPSLMTHRITKRWNFNGQPIPKPYIVKPDVVLNEFNRLSWAQWTEEEIALGAPFKRLLA